MTGWLIAVERTRAVFLLQLWINGLNIGLDLWFVLGLGWGVPGVALATLIAEWSGLALGLWFCRDAFGLALRAGLARIGDRLGQPQQRARRRVDSTARGAPTARPGPRPGRRPAGSGGWDPCPGRAG